MIQYFRYLRYFSSTNVPTLSTHKLITQSIPIVRKPRFLSTSKISNTPKIYTKTGDKGTSALLTGERRSKDNLVFEALGSTDELSSTIGLASEFATDNGHPFVDQLESIQCRLQELGSCIATPLRSASESQKKRVEFDSKNIKILEEWIDQMTAELPPLKNFILPSGGKTSSCLHLARTKCRSAERRMAALVNLGDADLNSLKYLNRLSDYLFTAARFAAKKEGKPEKIYNKSEK